jgi:hypothetical protein
MKKRNDSPSPAEGAKMLEDMAQREVRDFIAAVGQFIPTGKWPASPKKPTDQSRRLEKWAKGLKPDEVVSHALEAVDEVKNAADALLCIGQHRDEIGSAFLRTAIEEAIDGTTQLALGGSDQAVRDIYLLAVKCVVALETLEQTRLSAVKEIAEKRPDWPGFIGLHGDRKKRNDEKIATLGVGTKSVKNMARGWSNLPTSMQEGRVALGECVDRLTKVIEAARQLSFAEFATTPPAPEWLVSARTLPPLERSNLDAAETWFNVGWQMLRSLTQDKPETLPGLEKVGLFRAGTWKRMGATTGQQASQACQGLRERLRGAFMMRYFAKTEVP